MDGTAKTLGQIASGYRICPRTLKKWLKAENIIVPKGLLSPRIQEEIEKRFGKPVS